MTIWPAWQHYEEKAKGSIDVGKLADFVILSRDPTQGNPNSIDQIKVTATIKKGSTVFALTAEEQRRGALMLTPGSLGERAFGRALALAAGHRDPERAAGADHAHDDESHGLTCRSDFFVQLAAAMVSGSDTMPK